MKTKQKNYTFCFAPNFTPPTPHPQSNNYCNFWILITFSKWTQNEPGSHCLSHLRSSSFCFRVLFLNESSWDQKVGKSLCSQRSAQPGSPLFSPFLPHTFIKFQELCLGWKDDQALAGLMPAESWVWKERHTMNESCRTFQVLGK